MNGECQRSEERSSCALKTDNESHAHVGRDGNDPSITTRAIANAGVPLQPRVVQILHEHKYKNYYVEINQKLRSGDFARRYEFASVALEWRDVDLNFCQKMS